ncbi:8655_t:CDS:1, partial [Dentiscutata erythropus]
MKGQLDLSPFPNLEKVSFYYNVRFNILESIDLSKNEKLSRIVVDGQSQNFLENNSFTLLVKEVQLGRIILLYQKINEYGSAYIKTTNYLRKQTIIPYFLVEDRKLGQLEAEIANLKKSLAQKDQTIAQKDRTIADLNRKAQQTPTL